MSTGTGLLVLGAWLVVIAEIMRSAHDDNSQGAEANSRRIALAKRTAWGVTILGVFITIFHHPLLFTFSRL